MTAPREAGRKTIEQPLCSKQGVLVGLNSAQRAAVVSPASVVQVLAPPGSGKTKTLTSRVAHLITQHGYQPRNIIVCTFTVKAAREMQERVRGFLGEDLSKKLILGTFHSISRRYLAMFGSRIGLDSKFGIADSADTLAIVKRIVKKLQIGIEPNVARSRISRLKAKNLTIEQYVASINKPTRTDESHHDSSERQVKHESPQKVEAQEFAMVYAEYQEQLHISNLLDFDDLLLRCVELLRRSPECVSSVDAVLVDEFQDTSIVQFELLMLLAQSRQRITTVGDPDQSIYGWRSAEIGNLEKMRSQYPDTHVAKLEENYRSSGAILFLALEIIQQDEARPEKPLIATHSVGMSPVLRILAGASTEARWIISEIQRSVRLTAGLLNYNDFSILLRSAYLSRLIESELGRNGIPYRMVGGLKFYDRMEVKIVLDYLRVIDHPEHNDALARIINVPPRGVGGTGDKLCEEAEQERIPLWNFILAIIQGKTRATTKISSKALRGLAACVNLVMKARRRLADPPESSSPLTDYLEYIVKSIGLYGHLSKIKPEEIELRWANVEELIAQASDITVSEDVEISNEERQLGDVNDLQVREHNHHGPLEEALSSFLANVALASESRKDEEEQSQSLGQVTISTMHAAKGLEWPVVFIPAAYEGSIPHSRAEDTDEERRLLYVAMTRAQSLLYLSLPQQNTHSRETEMSTFLCPNEVLSLVSAQGPKFNFEVVKEIARILRRPCPTAEDIDDARTDADHVYDNLEPVITKTNEGYETEYYATEMPRYAEISSYASKRQRIGDHAMQQQCNLKSGSKRVMSAFKSVTTMCKPDGYSIANTTLSTTFVSASLLNIEEGQHSPTKSNEKSAVVSRDISRGKPARSTATTNQSSLKNFFTPRTTQQPISKEDLRRDTSCRSPDQASRAPLQESSSSVNSVNMQTNAYLEQQLPIDKATLHQPSFAQLHRPLHQRKTLGMKRSLHGWMPRTNPNP